MKTIKRTQMRGFEGKTLQELVDDFNRGMEWVSRTSASMSEPVVDIEHLRAFVIYEQVDSVPESIRDVLDLAGLSATCGICKQFRSIGGKFGRCQFCKGGDLRQADEACERFFRAWEHGECWIVPGEEGDYVQAVDEYKRESLRSVERRHAGGDC